MGRERRRDMNRVAQVRGQTMSARERVPATVRRHLSGPRNIHKLERCTDRIDLDLTLRLCHRLERATAGFKATNVIALAAGESSTTIPIRRCLAAGRWLADMAVPEA